MIHISFMLSEILISLRPIFETISIGLEIIGVIIIVYAAIITLGFLIKAEIRNRRQAGNDQHETKIQFTTRLLTALEFFIAADIIKTILSPDAMTLDSRCDNSDKGCIDFPVAQRAKIPKESRRVKGAVVEAGLGFLDIFQIIQNYKINSIEGCVILL